MPSTRTLPLTAANLDSALLASATLPRTCTGGRPSSSAARRLLGWRADRLSPGLPLLARPGPRVHIRLGAVSAFCAQDRAGVVGQGAHWRHAWNGAPENWYDNVLLVSPSPAFRHSLPRKKCRTGKTSITTASPRPRILNWKHDRRRPAFARRIRRLCRPPGFEPVAPSLSPPTWET